MQVRRFFQALALTLTACSSVAAFAETFPSHPIKMVVAFAPGGPSDLLARILATGMTKSLGQTVIVDNRSGAGGILGTQAVAQATADGYTLLFAGDSSLTVQPLLSPKNVSYHPVKDFVPLRMVASQANVLIANSSKGLLDVPTLIARAKAEPARVAFGSAGAGSPSHLIGALFQVSAGVDLVHVPYKGAAPAMTDLLGGQTDVMFVGVPVALQNARRKELAILAVSGAKRLPALPDTPTFAELGINGLGSESAAWWAVVAPTGIPESVHARLSNALQAAMNDVDVIKGFKAQGVDMLNLDGGTATKWIERDRTKWADVIKAKKITTE
ncbi:tripartite-type tricarboxylate transporter receptor subunit TctC [Variovorax boronicumulans]|uniref:Bug family tripartite tricarboxylate transporter substrate binding protein n=1 Tax=Variovorax boronicumulans TaxID=436515 RepID=UPI0033909258